jgi:phosphoribosylglycinamide formyltransferase-1
MLSIVILISGRGSNMEAILKARLPIDIRAVIANRPDAAGLETAAAAGITTEVVDHAQFPSRDAFDDALAACIERHHPDVIVLAGFMRILGRAFIERFPNKILNIHPSLLPAFPGLHTHQQALDAGVRIHGATVHVVTPELDAGPILAQVAVPVAADDDEASLAARVLRQEHVIYPAVLRRLAERSAPLGPQGVFLSSARRVEQLDASGEKLISL